MLTWVDVTVMEIETGTIDILSVAHEGAFGGQWINDILVDSIARKWEGQHSISVRGVSDFPVAGQFSTAMIIPPDSSFHERYRE